MQIISCPAPRCQRLPSLSASMPMGVARPYSVCGRSMPATSTHPRPTSLAGFRRRPQERCRNHTGGTLVTGGADGKVHTLAPCHQTSRCNPEQPRPRCPKTWLRDDPMAAPVGQPWGGILPTGVVNVRSFAFQITKEFAAAPYKHEFP